MALVWTLMVLMVGGPLATSAAAIGVGCCGEGTEHELGHECRLGKLEAMSEGGAFDAETGRDHRHFPPDRRVDHLHMKLSMRFEDLAARRFDAVQELRVRGLGLPVPLLELDAVDLEVKRVERDGVETPHYNDGRRLAITFDPPLLPGEESLVRIEYACATPAGGMTFTPAYPDDPARGFEVHTQGQPESNRNWFPCHDFPNERVSTELVVDVPAGYSASSNGELISHQEHDGRAIWHWKQQRPHVNYLVTLVIGTFSRVEISTGRNRVPMHVWCPPGMEEQARATYARSSAMMDLFEERFGLPYPWPRYDQLVVRNFSAGGMENTAATTMHPQALYDETALADADLDGLISHELAHQWFGDLITCRSWAHIWLNEGWATYSTALWFEERDGRDGYLDSMRNAFNVSRRDRVENPQPMVSNDYATPGETFGRAANPYSKGSSILHMLRCMLGEEVFWKGVRDYVAEHQDGVVETDDFRHALERASGLELEWYFTQWCQRPGTPRLSAEVAYDPARREVVVDVEQTQQVDARTPAFRFDLPVQVVTASGSETFVVPMRERVASMRFPVAEPPTMICVDPELHVLKAMEFVAPLPMLLAQAESGPTIATRRDGIDALRTSRRGDVIAVLDRIARDDTRRWTERGDAIAALRALDSPESRTALAVLLEERGDALACPRTRLAVVNAARGIDRDAAVAVLAEIAANDPSYACRDAAIDGLAELDARDHADLVATLVDFPSHGDRVRLAAIDALSRFEDPRSLEAALAAARLGNPDRARPRAIGMVGRLAEQDRERVVQFLLETLDDPERRSVQAAGEALASMKAPEARPRFEALASNAPPWLRSAAERWLRRYEEG